MARKRFRRRVGGIGDKSLRYRLILVAAAGLEPALRFSQKQILSLLCQPFHHAARAHAF